MSAINDKWTKEQFAEYKRQLAKINDAYGNSVPQEVQEHYAAEIVNKQIQAKV